MLPGKAISFQSRKLNLSKKLKKDVDVKQALKYVYEAITLTRHTLEGKVRLIQLLIGFSGAPVSFFLKVKR